MPRPKTDLPKLSVHKRSGRAFVRIDGKQVPCGQAGTPQAKAEYERIVAEWWAHRRCPKPAGAEDAQATVTMLCEAYWQHAQVYYTKPLLDDAGNEVRDGKGNVVRVDTGELDHFRQLIRPLRRLYGAMPAKDFSCVEAEALRAKMINPHEDPVTGKMRRGWSRTHTNQQMGRLRRMFAWGVTKNIVPVQVHQALSLMDGLRRGKTEARETVKVQPVEKSRALAVLPFVGRQVAAMIQIQLYSAMRSTEVCLMRPCDIERDGSKWTYTPGAHKTQHHGIARRVPLGRKARMLIAPFLKDRAPDAFLFSPAEANAERRAKARENRKTHVQPSQVLRSRKAAARKRKQKMPRARYTEDSYYRAVQYGCEKAFGMPRDWKYRREDSPEERQRKSKLRCDWYAKNAWHPHQLRHTGATAIASRDTTEAARIQLGHTTQKTTLIYVEPDLEKARRVVEKVG